MLIQLLPYVFAIAAGISFATWPVLTGISGVPAGATTFVMAGIAMILMLPVIYMQGGWPSVTPNAWRLVSYGGADQAVGIISLAMLALLTLKSNNFPDFFVICLVTQVCASAVIKGVGSGFTLRHLIGFTAAAVVAIAMGKS